MFRLLCLVLISYYTVLAFSPGALLGYQSNRITPSLLSKDLKLGSRCSVGPQKNLNQQFERIGDFQLSRTQLAASSDSDDAEPKKGLKLLICGAPAAGKGTQCAYIKETFGVVHLSTGDMLRAAVAAETEVGLSAKEFMESGKLVPDEVIIGIVKDRLDEEDCKESGWLLDGFPRTQAQAKALEDAGITGDCFIMLNVPDGDLVERVVGRRTDPETGDIYHMTFKPPSTPEVEARLVQRSDDTEEKVKVRLEQYHANVAAVKDSYTEITVEIDGVGKPTDVFEAIKTAVTEKVGA
eukprot:CAMPEP_0194146530 /NCGR_PEP_ID=MMETSP0152-20130528/20792_1 /TAXON_ID=1049557 /ORGANISM="Thalassiothrix antarctica, Strain L6-D1" /LENGTH=294 /DNA_ID=CAMNT_0038847071 /DNA_START=48 /DNA_END=932 /DNA_ORIENTATION=+